MQFRKKTADYSTENKILKCIYCGNSIFSVDDESLDLKDTPSFISTKTVVNVKGEETSGFRSDKIELLCCRCGLSLGYKLVDRSGCAGNSNNYIKVNVLEVSSNLQVAA